MALQSDDFDDVSEAFARWDHRFDQLDAGRFHGRVTFADLGGGQLFDVETDRRISARGSSPRGCYVFTPVRESNVDSVWRGHPHRLGTLNLRLPGDPIDHRTPRRYRNTSLVVDEDLLRRTAAQLGREAALSLLPGRQGLRIGTAACEALHREIVGTLRALALDRNGLFSPPCAAGSLRRLLRRLLQIASTGLEPDRPTLGGIRRAQVVRQAEEYLRSRLDRPASIPEVCQEVQVSERALHYAFRDQTGLSPMAYFKACRLNALRRELKEADRMGETVREVAERRGFLHAGELAAAYRRHFGRLPSQTLAGTRGVRSASPPDPCSIVP